MDMDNQAKKNLFIKLWRFLAVPESIWNGLTAVLPISIVIFTLMFLLKYFDGFGKKILNFFISPEYIFPYSGALLVFLLTCLIGRVLKYEKETGRHFLYYFLKKIPLIGGALGPRNRKGFLRVCLFWISPTLPMVGIITGEQKIEGLPHLKVVTSTINPPPGPVYLPEKRFVIQIGVRFEEAVMICTSYGMTRPELFKPIPWENETHEQAIERIKYCPWPYDPKILELLAEIKSLLEKRQL